MHFFLNAWLATTSPKEKIAYNKNTSEISKGSPQPACSLESPCLLPPKVGRINVENALHALTPAEMQHL